MNRKYELGFIIPTSVQESETQAVINDVREWIQGHEGTITNVDFWGRRRLAYPIQDFREGYYVFLQMEFPAQKLSELEHSLWFDERVLRHLVVRLDE
ncbi:MAG: 30S ribosomal protein S6 [Anaerolineae bacterium]|jgi:small subunit ribosomal protein S6|nr:30S ribosomal protein S6 [Anaerolineae bacterium]